MKALEYNRFCLLVIFIVIRTGGGHIKGPCSRAGIFAAAEYVNNKGIPVGQLILFYRCALFYIYISK